MSISATATPFTPQIQHSMAAGLGNYVSSGNIPYQIANTSTSLLADSDTVQRRSSRPSSLLSCDSLLAVRLQQEELWKPAKVRHNKSASSFSVFSAHAAHNNENFVYGAQASGAEPNINSLHALPQGESAIVLTSRRPHVHYNVSRKVACAKGSLKTATTRPKREKRMPNFSSVAPILLQPRRQIRKPRKNSDNWPLSLPFRDASFRENSRFFYADVFKDEARALRVNGFPIPEESVPMDALDNMAIKCLTQSFQPDKIHDEDIEISDVLFIGDHPDLSITFDLLPHPIHATSIYIRWLLMGATRFRTFLDCSIGQLRDVLVQKVIQQPALAAAVLTLTLAQADDCVRNGVVSDSIDPQHIKITFQGMLLRDDVILQELLVMWQALSPQTSSLLQLTFYICSPGEMWGVWQQQMRPVHMAQHLLPMQHSQHLSPALSDQHLLPAVSALHMYPVHAALQEPATKYVYGSQSSVLLPSHSYNK